MAESDVEGAPLSPEDEERLWNGNIPSQVDFSKPWLTWPELDACVSATCEDHESIDDALRTWLDLTNSILDITHSQADVISSSQMLLSSDLFQSHSGYVRTQIIHSLLQEDDTGPLSAITCLLLLDGHGEEALFPRMIEEACFPRLLELIDCGRKGAGHDPRLQRFLLQLMYEMSRMERLRRDDIRVVDDAFVHYLFGIIENVSDDVNDPYHYPTIRVLVSISKRSCSWVLTGK